MQHLDEARAHARALAGGENAGGNGSSSRGGGHAVPWSARGPVGRRVASARLPRARLRGLPYRSGSLDAPVPRSGGVRAVTRAALGCRAGRPGSLPRVSMRGRHAVTLPACFGSAGQPAVQQALARLAELAPNQGATSASAAAAHGCQRAAGAAARGRRPTSHGFLERHPHALAELRALPTVRDKAATWLEYLAQRAPLGDPTMSRLVARSASRASARAFGITAREKELVTGDPLATGSGSRGASRAPCSSWRWHRRRPACTSALRGASISPTARPAARSSSAWASSAAASSTS